jgi:SAM-dependent methyltransferase
LSLFADKLVWLFGEEMLADWLVIDVGGGDGWLADYLPYFFYWCLDRYVLPPANLPADRLHVYGRAEMLPFADGEADLVVSKQTLVHFADPVVACREMLRVAQRAVVIRQEFPESPIGWPGHSRVTIDSPEDILTCLRAPGWTASYDGQDFIARREGGA